MNNFAAPPPSCYGGWGWTKPKLSKMVSVCPEVTALKKCEEEVVDSLMNANLDCLSREASEIGAVSQNVRDDVKSIDWDHVPRPRVIRYLLMNVYRAIEGSPRLYERWLRVLSKHVASAVVLDKVRESFPRVPPDEVWVQTKCHMEEVGCDTGANLLSESEHLQVVAML